tara:strand:- start:639 stop:1514 length:876 start_codon:yes stop_codon:yes gene_type:complete
LDILSFLKALFNLMKPRVMSLVIFTCVVGLLISPKEVNYLNAIFSIIAVALGSGSAGALNMWYESELDSIMTRTCLRPIPTGKVTRNQALIFGVLTSVLSIIMLYYFSNLVATLILLSTILFYVFVYTMWLKPKTSQNIVIGGAAGALPPVIGWSIATGSVTFEPIILFLIIFMWTPSHFWALSIYKTEDYKNAKIPMLPVTSGIKFTKINIFIYALLLLATIITPFFLNYFGLFYFLVSGILGVYYVYICYKLLKTSNQRKEKKVAKNIFTFSILFLFLTFVSILVDSLL